MDELSDQNEIGSQVLDTPEPQNNTLSTENIPLIDQSDDDLLLRIPPIQNDRKGCSQYWLEILIGFIALFVVLMLTISGILFFKETKASLISDKGCNRQSETGMVFS